MEEASCIRAGLGDSGEHSVKCGSHGHCYGQVHIGGYATVQLGDRNIRLDPSSDDASTLANNQAKVEKEELQELLSSLSFGLMQFRVNNVKSAMHSTCQWLFRHSAFREWYDLSDSDNTSGFLWIKGKPGCGKSTLMKAALEWIKKNNPEGRNVVPFFFHARGSLLQKSALGFYRNLVHNLLLTYKSLAPSFFRRFQTKKPSAAGDSWTKEELQEYLFDVVETQYPGLLCILIDALDEVQFDDDVRDMIRFLIELTDRARDAGNRLQVCLSSRHYPHISIGRGFSLMVEDQPAHSEDIKLYIDKQLVSRSGTEMDLLRAQILHKSAGVFLWVVLVVHILQELDDSGVPVCRMQARLDTVPAALNDLFRDILLRSEHGIEASVLCFQWMVFGLQPLTAHDLYVAMEYSRSPHEVGRKTCIDLPSSSRLSRYILNCSRGLAEITPGRRGVVQFIHETVREFLLTGDGLASIAQALTTNLHGISHEILRIACFRYFWAHPYTAPNPRLAGPHSVWPSYADAPFLEYAVRHLFSHANLAMFYGIPQDNFIADLMTVDGFVHGGFRLWWNLVSGEGGISSGTGLYNFISERKHDSLANAVPASFKTQAQFVRSLRWFLYSDRFNPLSVLLDRYLKTGSQPFICYTEALSVLVGKGDQYSGLVKKLLDLGACADGLPKSVVTLECVVPLCEAAHKGHLSTVELLLQYGADVNKVGQRGSALKLSATARHHTISKLLLNHGAKVDHYIYDLSPHSLKRPNTVFERP